MKNILLTLSLGLLAGAASLSASSICPSTPTTTTNCDFIITIGTTGTATVAAVPGSTPFNGPVTFLDGTSDPGGDGSLVGVINNDAQALTGFTLEGSGAGAGVFDFSFNGICVYTNAAYCSTAQTGYEGPTTTFTNLLSTVLFQTTEGTVQFGPALGSGQSTYFAIEDAASDITSNGGLTVSNVTFAATPEPSEFALLSLGVGLLFVGRSKFKQKK
jgi:hypothetical protein